MHCPVRLVFLQNDSMGYLWKHSCFLPQCHVDLPKAALDKLAVNATWHWTSNNVKRTISEDFCFFELGMMCMSLVLDWVDNLSCEAAKYPAGLVRGSSRRDQGWRCRCTNVELRRVFQAASNQQDPLLNLLVYFQLRPENTLSTQSAIAWALEQLVEIRSQPTIVCVGYDGGQQNEVNMNGTWFAVRVPHFCGQCTVCKPTHNLMYLYN